MSPGDVMLLTAVIAAVLLVVGLALAIWGEDGSTRRDIGISFFTSAWIGFAIFGLQLFNDQNTKRVERDRQEREKRESFLLTIAVTENLSGFDPGGRSLAGVYLGAKTLRGARLQSVDMREAVLRDSSLRQANLRNANLERADLLNASLYRAVLTAANLEGADLRFARFEQAQVEDIRSLRGARTNAETCWPPGFLRLRLARQLRAEKLTTPDGQRRPPSRGHDCRAGEHRKAGPGV